jgi:hypothetical protein
MAMNAKPDERLTGQRHAQAAIAELIEDHVERLTDLVWVSEAERWAELVFWLLNECGQQDVEYVQKTVAVLDDLGLLEMPALAALDGERRQVVLFVLKQHLFSDEEARRALELLCSTARAFGGEQGGRLQHYLRGQFGKLRADLVDLLRPGGLPDEGLSFAVTRWLQSAFGAPLSLRHQPAQDFCKQRGLVLDDLETAADDLDVTLAAVDRLIELDQAATSVPSATQPG